MMRHPQIEGKDLMLAKLAACVTRHGSSAAAARALGYTPSHLCDLRSGRRLPSVRLLRKLGLRRVRVLRITAAA